MRARARGFTLIELMIVLVIIGILARIAIPQYRSYVEHARRSEVQHAIYGLAGALERCFTLTSNFSDTRCSTMAAVGYPVNVPQSGTTPYYTLGFTTSVGTPNNYTITATRVGIQANDRCGDYTLNQSGVRTPAATGANFDCWPGS